MRLAVGDAAPGLDATDGRGRAFSLAASKTPVVVVFLRHLGCPICRMELVQWAAGYADFRERAEVVVLLDSPAASVAEYAAKVDFTVIADHDHRHYRAWGVERGGLGAFVGGTLATTRATLRGHLHGRFEGDELQQPADFVVAGGNVVYAHYGRHIGDLTPLPALLAEIP